MGHRRTFHTFQMPEMDHDQIRNNRQREHQIYPENDPLLLPVDNVATHGLRSTTYANVTMSSSDAASSTSDLNSFCYGSSNVISMNGPYLPPSASSIGQVPQAYCQHASTNFYGQTSASTNGAYHMETDRERLAFKRKRYPASMALDRPVDGSYSGESSSSISVPSNHVEPQPISNVQSSAWTPMGIVRHGGAALSFAEEASQRNVRSRHDQVHGVQSNPCGINLLNYQYYRSTANHPAPHMAGHSRSTYEPLPEEVGLSSHHSDVSNHDINRSNARNSFSPTNMEIELGQTSNLVSTPRVHGTSTGMALDHSNLGQITTSYRITPNFAPVGSERTPEDGTQVEHANFSSSRRSRQLIIAHRNNIGRNAGPRNFYNRYQYPTDDHHISNRWVSRGPLLIGRSTYYGPRNINDEHQGMRLDIDNMSYEELIALGERIGNVSTGLSEDKLSKFLVETIYCSSDQMQDDSEESRCAICLEDYEDCESLGRLDCGHDFHFSCIKKWLQVKNVCPICKASFPADTPQQE